MRRIFLKIILASFYFVAIPVTPACCQEQKVDMVKYTPDFRFKDGIFTNFEQVKENDPIPKAKLLSSVDYNSKDFFKKLFESEKIYYYDAMGVRQEVSLSSLWGYSRNGVIYIQIDGNFNRITFIGSICHFVADVTTYDSRYYDPYSYGYNPYGYGGYYSPYGYSPYRQSSQGRTELKQYIFDFESGKLLEFDVDNTLVLLMKDTELYDEFVQLSRKKKKEQMFVFLRKFNERNPLYIPENK